MADVTKVKTSDGVIHDLNDSDDYTKDEVDTLLAGKADVGDSYTKSEADELLAVKANASDVEGALALKANVVDVYSKTEADNLLAGKADTGVSYTKAEDDALLGVKANAADVYTKTEADGLLAAKANSADVYTISQTDGLLASKAGIDDSSTTATMATWSASKLAPEFQGKADASDVYDKTEVYTKAEVDALIGGIKMFPNLDWANPVHVFDGTHLSFTATEKCYLFGNLYSSSSATTSSKVAINGRDILATNTSNSVGHSLYVEPPIPLNAGDTCTITMGTGGSWQPTISMIAVYKERS